ncbi:hypothetical protein PAESOLCIP111_05492 [Paenibacillus solanacearum]|uniref:Acetyl xylan esterase domain-containing protein n=1 Tax=Paenibacillus solanacearum TaxID=2048548 RepID=A0A916NLE2_9BACL|nr:acetylxylan esterase [Paenibacillus solanacearum]CAG7647952.1 hypothetical protein PAESOLCIP111_05492 [Paenibacillus solanacearum]
MNMKYFLNTLSEQFSERPLPIFASESEIVAWNDERRTLFHQAIGIDTYLAAERTPLNVRVTGTIDCGTHTIEKLYYESLPQLYVAGNLYIPKGLTERAPGILYVCGHSQSQKVQYQEHARRFAQLGFVTLIVDTVQYGEVYGEHHGTYARGWFQWVSKGYTPTATEVWNAIRGLDLLSARQDVDATRLGVTGHSGGGSISWWTMCADERVKAIATSSGTGHEASHIRERTLDGHCDCNFPNNPYGWSLTEQYALAAPRPVLILAPDRDYVFQIDSVRQVYDKLYTMYDSAGVGDRMRLLDYRSNHAYTPESRQNVFSWFLCHLAGKSVRPDEIEDFDGVQLEEKQLLAYEGRPPAADRSLTVQDWFIPVAAMEAIDSREGFQTNKTQLIQKLKQDGFRHFPVAMNRAKAEIMQHIWGKVEQGWRLKFTYESEENWKLWGEIRGNHPDMTLPADVQQIRPLAIHLRSTGDEKGEQAFDLMKSATPRWLKARLDPRGTGDTAWGQEQNWHIRRASALLGRTVASMRVWDTLRGIEAQRNLPGVDSKRIVLAGAGEMAVVALYAALLDGGIEAVVLQDAPGTLDAADDGKPNMLFKEVINALRYADLPQTAASLWPTKLVFVGEKDDSYIRTQRSYEALGGVCIHVSKASEIDFDALCT